MIILSATCKNGLIQLDQPLPEELEGKQIQVIVQEVSPTSRKRRQAGSAAGQIWMSPDFDVPLEEFQVSSESSLDASSYQKFKASGFIGCVSIEEDLSMTYKQSLFDKLNE